MDSRIVRRELIACIETGEYHPAVQMDGLATADDNLKTASIAFDRRNALAAAAKNALVAMFAAADALPPATRAVVREGMDDALEGLLRCSAEIAFAEACPDSEPLGDFADAVGSAALSIDQVAAALGLQVKTTRAYCKYLGLDWRTLSSSDLAKLRRERDLRADRKRRGRERGLNSLTQIF